MTAQQWSVDQMVVVEPRTWAGINRPGGVAKVTKLHYAGGLVESMDVQYMIGGGRDLELDLDFVRLHEPLNRSGRARRQRDFYQASPGKQPAAPKRRTKKRKQQKQADVDDTPELLDVPPAEIVSDSSHVSVSPLRDTPKELRQLDKQAQGNKKKKPKAKRALVIAQNEPVARKEEDESLVSDDSVAYTVDDDDAAMQPARVKKKPSLPLREKPRDKQVKLAPLQQVYKNQVDRAKTFCEQLIGKPPALKMTGSPACESTKPLAAASVTPAVAAVADSPINTERQELCMKLLSEILRADDEVCKADILSEVNKKQEAITWNEVDHCLGLLENQGKIMVSEGVVYTI